MNFVILAGALCFRGAPASLISEGRLGEYQPKYKWRVTWPNQEDAGSHQTDFCGWDADICIGRIRLEPHGLKKDQWQWSGGGPNGVRERLLPHQGFEPTAKEAARMVEDYYERLMRDNGLIGGQDSLE